MKKSIFTAKLDKKQQRKLLLFAVIATIPATAIGGLIGSYLKLWMPIYLAFLFSYLFAVVINIKLCKIFSDTFIKPKTF